MLQGCSIQTPCLFLWDVNEMCIDSDKSRFEREIPDCCWSTDIHIYIHDKYECKHAHIYLSGFLIHSQIHTHTSTYMHRESSTNTHTHTHTHTHKYGTCPAFAHCHHTHVRSPLVATATPTSGSNTVHVTWLRRGGSKGCSVPTCICLFNITAHFMALYSVRL